MNIILQHWTGDIPEIVALSSKNIEKYADGLGVHYRLLRGQVFRENLTSACQKVFMLDESWDDYDQVVMLDPDMFVVSGMSENVFELKGNGIEHRKSFQRMRARFPALVNGRYPFWGGAIYRFNQVERESMRKHIRDSEMLKFGTKRNDTEDEGIMHRLASLAQMPKKYIHDRWAWGSHWDNPENAAIIHVRRKYYSNGQLAKRDKMLNYSELKEKGVIE